MAAAPTPAMDKAELKALLVKSKTEPVSCAIGLTKDKQALILLHKTKPSMALVKELEKQSGPLTSPCHGTAMVNAEVDAKLVVLTLNKAPGGIGAKLKKTLASAGFPKIQIKLEDGTLAESADEEEGEAAAPGNGAALPDAVALKSRLAALIGMIPAAIAADPAAKGPLVQLATGANASLKTADLSAAAALINQLREALAKLGGPPKASGKPDPAILWRDAKELVGKQISRLQDVMRAQQHPMFDRIADQGLNGVTGKLQVGLHVALANLGQASGDERIKAAAKVKSGVAEFRKFLQSDPVVPLLESNPFGIAVKLRATLGQALDAIDNSLAS